MDKEKLINGISPNNFLNEDSKNLYPEFTTLEQKNLNYLYPGKFPQGKLKKAAYFCNSPLDILNELYSILMKDKPVLKKVTNECSKKVKFNIYSCPEFEINTEIPENKVLIFQSKKNYGCCKDKNLPEKELTCRVMTEMGLKDIPFLRIDNQCICSPCKNCGRTIQVYYIGKGCNGQEGDFLGQVYYQQSCCERKYAIYLERVDLDVNPNLIIRGPCCVCHGPMCCECCKESHIANFDIFNNFGECVGNFLRNLKTCDKGCSHFFNQYQVNFQKKLNWKEKAMILATVHMICQEFIRESQSNSSNNQF